MKINIIILRQTARIILFILPFLFCSSLQASDETKNSDAVTIQVSGKQDTGHKNEVLIVRGDHNYPPYEYINEEGHPEGFNVDIVNGVAKAMGLNISINLGPWDKVTAQLERGEIDALIGMFNTLERDKKFDFSIPHFIASCAVFVRHGSPIQSLADVYDKHVIVQLRDLGHDYLEENGITPHIITKQNWEDVLTALSAGEGDCAIVSRIQGTRLIGKLAITNIEAVGPPIIQRKYGLAVTEGNTALLAKLNEGLDIIKQTGTYDNIYNKWFGIYEEHSPSLEKFFYYAMWIIVPLLLLAITGFLWSWALKKQVALKTEELEREIADRKKTEKEKEMLIIELQTALEEIKTLKGIIPICMHCKGIRDDKGAWKRLEEFITEHSEAQFSHGICEECLEKYYPEGDG